MRIFLFTLLFVLSMTKDTPPQQPIIGIYTEDAQTFLSQNANAQTYIAASYVKNIQMAGAQVVPIFYHLSQAKLEALLNKINGVLLPGGQMPIDFNNQWTSNIAFIYKYANRQNQMGNPFPIWSTCLGFQTMLYITSGQTDNTTVFTEVFGQGGKTCPLFVKNEDSELLKTLSSEQYNEVTTGDGLLFYHHRWSILQSTFNSNSEWSKVWKMTSTSKTGDGTQFVSTIEGIKYPYFGTQYHPEKNSFEWRVPAKRTYNAVIVEQKFINLFMKYARKNKNVYPLSDFKNDVIYNYQPVLTPLDYPFVQVYIFDESTVNGQKNIRIE